MPCCGSPRIVQCRIASPWLSVAGFTSTNLATSESRAILCGDPGPELGQGSSQGYLQCIITSPVDDGHDGRAECDSYAKSCRVELNAMTMENHVPLESLS